MNWQYLALYIVIEFSLSLVTFIILSRVGKYVYGRLKSSSFFRKSRLLNLSEYLPEEEFNTMRQVFYLIMIVLFVVDILYIILSWGRYSTNLLLLDIIVSLYAVVTGDFEFSKNKLVYIMLIPFASLSYLFFDASHIYYLDIIHVLVFPYMIRLYYSKFVEYTETNSLGITILLLFSIVFISFINTMIVEGVSPLDSLVMVSNAFTSNGYAILGHSTFGKINALVLVWSGFILSGVGTATLAVAIVMKYANEKFDHLEELVRKNRKK